MSSTNYTRWWRDDTVAVIKNSNEVVETSSYWVTGNINPGNILKINGEPPFYIFHMAFDSSGNVCNYCEI